MRNYHGEDYAEEEEFADLDNYLSQKGPRLGNDFFKIARYCLTSETRNVLTNLVGFRFKRHPKYNLPEWRLECLEALVNDKVSQIIDFIKSKGLKVRLISNGYILSKDEYINMANKCDEIIGEIKAITEEDFKKLQRPIEGYTLEDYIENMVSFNK